VPLSQLRRVRWAVRGSLVLGVAASVCANVLHANPNPIAQTIAAWPPLALLLTVELISRVPIHRRDLAIVRVLATTAIAGIAAWVSYWHMMGVAARYGETGSVPYLLPLSVDGLVIVASVSLVELGARIREIESAAAVPAAVEAEPVAVEGLPAAVKALPVAVEAGPAHPAGTEPVAAEAAGARREPTVAVPGEATVESTVELPMVQPRATPARTRPGQGTGSASRNGSGQRNGSAPRNGSVPRTDRPTGRATGRAAVPPARRRPVAETRALVAQLTAQDPAATHDDLARQLGISTKRLRTVLADAKV
jgi:hypothetical protein